MPLYYLVAVMGVSKIFDIIKLRGSAEWFWFIAVSGFFLVVTLTNVTKSFYYGPAIKYEINYIEYAGLYDAVTENCKNKVIIEAAPSSPFIAKFYGVNVDYVFSAPEYAEKYGLFVLKESIGEYVTVWGDVPVITDVNELKLLNRDICLTVRGPSKKAFFPAAAEDVLKSADQSWSFHNLDLYLLTQKTLRE